MSKCDRCSGCVGCGDPTGSVRRDAIQKSIDLTGCAIIPVIDVNPFFAYTIGLTESQNCPELIIIINYPIESVAKILEGTINEIKRDKAILKRGRIDNFFGPNSKAGIAFRTITDKNKSNYCGQNFIRYGDKFSVLQVILSDPDGKFSWEAGYNSMVDVTYKQIALYK